jgi:antitoxin (DNA-binding transcriptional repressor) of toxin-antitoxin stability system
MKVTVEEATDQIADLLEKVKSGLEVTIYDGDKAVATIRPAEGLVLSNLADPSRPLRDIDLGPAPKRRDFDALEFLMADRNKDRGR